MKGNRKNLFNMCLPRHKNKTSNKILACRLLHELDNRQTCGIGRSID